MVVSRRKIILIPALGAIGLALIITAFYLAGEAKHIALRKITQAVDSALHEPYRFELQDFQVRLVDGVISIPGFKIYPDSAALAQMEAPPRTLYSIDCGRVEVRIRRERRKVLEIRSVRIIDPHIRIQVDSSRPDPARAKKPFKLPFNAVNINSIVVSGGSLRYDSLAVEGIALDWKQVVVDTTLRITLPPVELDIAALLMTRHTPTDITRLSTGAIRIAGFDIAQLLDNKLLIIDSIAVASPNISSYKNRRVRRIEHVKPLFHQVVQRLPIGLDISKITITDGHARYEELPATGAQAGMIRFERIDARIDSLTNIDSLQDYYTLDATALLYGAGPVRLHADLPVDPLHDHFMMRGGVGPMPLTDFNPMVRPLGHMGVHTGRLQRLWFNLEGDSHNGLVTMRMEYDSLRIELLDQEGLTSLVGSALANALIVRDANPMPGHSVREVTATAARNPYRSHFNYLWRIVFAGIKPSVGLGEGEQKMVSALQEKLQRLKMRHAERKAARQARHANNS